VTFGTYREVYGFPSEPVAYVRDQRITLRTFTTALGSEMRNLQSQISGAQNNPAQAQNQIQRLMDAQEKLPEEVLERQIESSLIRSEAERRGITIPPSDVDAEINKNLSVQRDVLNQPTATQTSTATPRPSLTPTPEGFEPSPTSTPTPTLDPAEPTATLDPLTPTLTRTPFPTRPTITPVVSPTVPPTLSKDEFDKAYHDNLLPILKSESDYRSTIELQLERQRLRDAIGADVPTSGPRARVQRIVTSTRDEARVALIQVEQGFPIEEIAGQANERPAEGTLSGDLGWVARGAETREFDQVVFSDDTPLNQWTEPFASGNHWETVQVLERGTGPYDDRNLDKMKDRAFKEWLDSAKQGPDIQRDLSPQERQWAVDRASKGIFETTTNPR
jgi:parvulin-like peptidyl-prolyl isomerase